MFYVTKEEVLQRWDAIPDVLKEATALEANTDFIWKTCEDEHLPEEKGRDVARITGYVLLGFIHPEDLGRELADALKIPKEMAGSIAGAINARVFEPLKNDISAIYEPPSKFGPLVSEPPKPIEEIKRVPAPSLAPPSPSGPAASSSGLVGEFARLSINEKPAIPSPRESASSPRQSVSMEPPPTMLHEETPIKSAPQTSSFKIEAPTPKLSDIRAKESEIPKPAILDFGGSTDSPQEKPPVPPPLPKTAVPESKPFDTALGKPFDSAQGKPFDNTQGKPPRIVHYTEFRTPLDDARGKPLEKPQEKPSEISGAQAPSNVPLAENPLSKISGENPERKEVVPEPETPPTPPKSP